LLCDILWSDPSEESNTWEDNDRGVSFVFSKEIVDLFVKKNNIDLICRAHQVKLFNFRLLKMVMSSLQIENWLQYFQLLTIVENIQTQEL
jgi:hypothetical protein